MGAEKIGSMKCVSTQKVLPSNGGNPKFEVVVPSGSGTLAGAEVLQAMSTYYSEVGADGIIRGECPDAGVIMVADGMATFSATGVGSFTEDGGASFKGMAYFKASAPSLASLNGAAVVFNWDVDGAGNGPWELWEGN